MTTRFSYGLDKRKLKSHREYFSFCFFFLFIFDCKREFLQHLICNGIERTLKITINVSFPSSNSGLQIEIIVLCSASNMRMRSNMACNGSFYIFTVDTRITPKQNKHKQAPSSESSNIVR